MSIPSSSWHHHPDAAVSGRALVRAARHRLSTFRGLGDFVAWLLSSVGIDGSGACGCGRRQKWLNRIAPFRFTGKSLFDRRSTVVASAVLVNRLGTSVHGRIQVRTGEDEARVIEVPELRDGATTRVLESWTTSRRLRDRWSWMLEDDLGHVYTGHVVCGIEGPVELWLEATPRPRLELRQAHGACVVDLA